MKHQSHLIPYDTVANNKNWFEYVVNTNAPESSTFRCKLCYKYYDKFGLEARYKNALAYPEGTLKFQKHTNKQIISEHSNCPGHTTIVQILQRQHVKRLGSLSFNISSCIWCIF